MNKIAIKDFAIIARKKLMASVKDKAGKIGITANDITSPITKGDGFAVFPSHFGTETTLTGKELTQRDNLINRINEKGYDSVMEEVAYTWFNRLIAVRFMEVNDYLPTRIRVLSSETKDKLEPDMITKAPTIDLKLTEEEKDEIMNLKMKNQMDSLFQMLFIKQCNALGEILPELFENTSKQNKDYTEILLDLSYTNEDSVIRDLLKIEEEDFLDAVEIIGWMYQYYNTEPKEETFALLKKNVKITKERLPSATQLFTPDWIVRYMVENSLGRLWLEGHEDTSLKANWKYYLDEAEQEPEVVKQLEILRMDAENINPEDIKLIDPCMGSGHILVYAFEVLMQIYESCGYTQRDAAQLIIERNLYGLDIDDRAFQLAYFALMMKGRKYNRRLLTRGIRTNLCGIQESNAIEEELVDFIGKGDTDLQKEAKILLDLFMDAKEYGSILEVPSLNFEALKKRVKEIEESLYDNIVDRIHQEEVLLRFVPLLKQAEIMAEKYEVVITNPPYMGNRGMSIKLGDYVKKHYPDSKSDLFAVFIEKCSEMAKQKGYYGLVTQPSILFLSSFEKLRKSIMTQQIISSLLHMGRGIFGIDFGSTAFVIKKMDIKNYVGCYFRLHERTFQYIDPDDIAKLYLLAKETPDFKYDFGLYQTNNDIGVNRESEICNKDLQIYYETKQENFSKIPGMPIAYWGSENEFNIFEKNKKIGDIYEARGGMTSGNNNLFVRCWYEIVFNKIGIGLDKKEAKFSDYVWFPYNKGGSFRKWYGNIDFVINWYKDGSVIKKYKLKQRETKPNYNIAIAASDSIFKPQISWSFVSSNCFGTRYYPKGFLFDVAGSSLFVDKIDELYLLAYLNSIIAHRHLQIINPTLNFQPGNIKSLTFIKSMENEINLLAKKCINISKIDWDSFETSWDFRIHPLVLLRMEDNLAWADQKPKHLISSAFKAWELQTDAQFAQLKVNEEELNRIFIDIYGLEDELTPEVEDKDVTIRRADLGRDIRSLLSYAVGCMLGRYSLEIEGLAYAGGNWESQKYKTIIPDQDNIIPITDEEYFDDDMVAHLVDFVKVVYGVDTLEENLDFIAKALGNRGNTSREIIRNYFLNGFYKDHVKIYQKRPIYWLFDSGKQNGFKALIYMHRYDEDTVGRIRTDYLHKIQRKLEDLLNHCNMILGSDAPAGEKAIALKKKETLIKQLAETKTYDQAIAHIALQRIPIDLDDGVKVNYAKFQNVEVASEGKKSVKVNLLAKI